MLRYNEAKIEQPLSNRQIFTQVPGDDLWLRWPHLAVGRPARFRHQLAQLPQRAAAARRVRLDHRRAGREENPDRLLGAF